MEESKKLHTRKRRQFPGKKKLLSFIGISWLTGALTFLALSLISPALLKEMAAQTQSAFTSVTSTLPSLIMTKTEKVVHSFCELESSLPPEAKQILQEITMGQRSARALEDNFDRSTPPGTKPDRLPVKCW